MSFQLCPHTSVNNSRLAALLSKSGAQQLMVTPILDQSGPR